EGNQVVIDKVHRDRGLMSFVSQAVVDALHRDRTFAGSIPGQRNRPRAVYGSPYAERHAAKVLTRSGGYDLSRAVDFDGLDFSMNLKLESCPHRFDGDLLCCGQVVKFFKREAAEQIE